VKEPAVDMDMKRDSELKQNGPDAVNSMAVCVGFIVQWDFLPM
jgi:hypothetical protein